MKTIYHAESVKVTLGKSKPPILDIAAVGTVRTGGWTKGSLLPYVYVRQPEDGIQDFDFIAEPPSGMVSEVISPISAHYSGACGDWVEGVRIHSETNEIVERIQSLVQSD